MQRHQFAFIMLQSNFLVLQLVLLPHRQEVLGSGLQLQGAFQFSFIFCLGDSGQPKPPGNIDEKPSPTPNQSENMFSSFWGELSLYVAQYIN